MSKSLDIDWDSACLSLIVFAALTAVSDLTRAIRDNTAARREVNAMLRDLPETLTASTPKE